MRVIETKVFTFDELSDEAKQKAIEWYKSISSEELDTEGFTELLESNGFLNPKIWYSGFYCQGDGASFDAKIDVDRFLVGEFEELKDLNFQIKIETINHYYVHERTRKVEASWWELTKEQGALIEKLANEIEDLRLTLCQQIYRSLESDYDYITSDEHISEILSFNDYEFTETGKII